MIMVGDKKYGCNIVGGEFHPIESRTKRDTENKNEPESISGVVYDATLSMYLPEVSNKSVLIIDY